MSIESLIISTAINVLNGSLNAALHIYIKTNFDKQKSDKTEEVAGVSSNTPPLPL